MIHVLSSSVQQTTAREETQQSQDRISEIIQDATPEDRALARCLGITPGDVSAI